MIVPHITPILTSSFGSTRGRTRPHTGIDTIPAGSGHWQGITPEQKKAQNKKRKVNIVSIMPGIVVFADWINGAGNTVAVEGFIDDDAYTFIYCHLDSIDDNLRLGHWIDEGTVLGIMGGTGLPETIAADNVHLHLSVTKNSRVSVPDSFYSPYIIDPMQFFKLELLAGEGWELKVKGGI